MIKETASSASRALSPKRLSSLVMTSVLSILTPQLQASSHLQGSKVKQRVSQAQQDPKVAQLEAEIKHRNEIIAMQAKLIAEAEIKQKELKAEIATTAREQANTLAALNSRLEAIDAAIKAERERYQELEKSKELLEGQLKTIKARLAILNRTQTITIIPTLLDVYNDGSVGPDNWTVTLELNGKPYTLWSRQKVSDDGTVDNGPGPGGNLDCTRYEFKNGRIKVKVKAGDKIELSISGVAHDNNHPIPVARMTLNAANEWGTKGTPLNGSSGVSHKYKGAFLNRIGSVDARKDVEFWFFFQVEKSK